VYDPERILRLLNDAGVAYVIIGGLANNLHGYDRATGDLDICYDRSRTNIRQLVLVLRAVDAAPRSWPPDLPFVLDEQTLRNGDGFTFTTSSGDLDLLGTPAGSEGYGDLVQGAELMEIDPGFVVPVVGLDDLIRLKRAAGRPKDMADLPDLERLRDLRGGGTNT
jgi:hypothetical protein